MQNLLTHFGNHRVNGLLVTRAWQRMFLRLLFSLLSLLVVGIFLIDPVGSLAQQAGQIVGMQGFTLAGEPWVNPVPAYRIAIESDGIFELNYELLNGAGLPVGVGGLDPDTFRLFWMGQEVAVRVLGGEDGVFDPGDVLLFYGRGVDEAFYDGLLPTNKYTGTNIYWLTYDLGGAVSGLRMAEKDGSLTGSQSDTFLYREHLEHNPYYVPVLPLINGADHWYAYLLRVPDRSAYTYKFQAQNVASGSHTATLFVNAQGSSRTEHDLRVELNGHELLSGTAGLGWGGTELFTITLEMPQSFIQEGDNEIRLQLLENGDSIYVNWFEIAYSADYVAGDDVLSFAGDVAGPYRYEVTNFSTNDIEVYDISDMFAVQYFANGTVAGNAPYSVGFGDMADSHRYVALTSSARLRPARIEQITKLHSPYAPVDLLDGGNVADYIIITHGDFWAEAERLAAHRATDHTVALVDVQRIYDLFNGGMMSAEAINDFLAYAYQNWLERPDYVVLIGDGVADMRNYRKSSSATFIPPYLAKLDHVDGESASDNLFVTVDGNDHLPDMHIGRLSVNSPAEASMMVSKIIAYETQCACGDWNRNVLFVTDDLEGGGGNFYRLSNTIADGYADAPDDTIKYLPTQYTPIKAHLGETCDLDNPARSVECTYRITNTLETIGALLVNYVGHSTKHSWASREQLLNYQAMNTVDNNPCLPIMLAMSCQSAAFQYSAWMTPVFGEVLTRATENQAIAYWGSTGNGTSSGQDYLDRGFFLAIFQEGISEMGPATTYAKQYMADNTPPGAYNDLMDKFILLGDPGLKIKVANNCVDLDSDNDGVPDGLEVGSDAANPVDTDEDSLPNYLDTDDDGDGWSTISEDIDVNGSPLNDDSDLDGIVNYLDFDPVGYLYDEDSGQILSGGSISISGPGNIDVVADGSAGYYHFLTDGTAGVYEITVTPPAGYVFSESCLSEHSAPFDSTIAGPNPAILGNGETASTGFLMASDCTSFYYSVYLADAGPVVVNNNFPLRLQELSSVTGRVWWDMDGNGSQDDGEPGIPGVNMVLAGEGLFSTTDSDGKYEFNDMPAGILYTVNVASAEFQASGILEGWESTFMSGNAPADLNGGEDKITSDAEVAETVDGTSIFDFGFDILSSYAVSSHMNAAGPVRNGAVVNFTVHITNTGKSTIVVLPLQNSYDAYYLQYGVEDEAIYADPSADDAEDDGLITWGDLTNGLGLDLAPGDSFVVTTTFTAEMDTTQLSGGVAEVKAVLSGVRADPDGDGPIGGGEQLPSQEVGSAVQIMAPTAVMLASLDAQAYSDGVQLIWEMGSEVDVMGFNLLRSEAGGVYEMVNDELIFAEMSGRSGGGVYTFWDDGGQAGRTYEYVLEILKLDGSREQPGTVSVSRDWWVQLPFVM